MLVAAHGFLPGALKDFVTGGFGVHGVPAICCLVSTVCFWFRLTVCFYQRKWQIIVFELIFGEWTTDVSSMSAYLNGSVCIGFAFFSGFKKKILDNKKDLYLPLFVCLCMCV